MKGMKVILSVLVGCTFLVGCSKDIEENKKDIESQAEATTKSDSVSNSSVNKDEARNEVEKVESSTVKENKKVKLNVETKVQEVWNYCAPTTVSMILSARGIDVDQYTLAREMGTYEPFGTHNKDAIRILNKYMFGYEIPAENQAGYRIEVVKEASKEEIELFKKRLKKNIADGYPLYLTLDTSKIYPGLHGEHNVAAIGYIENDSGDIDYVYYQDPAPKVQDKQHKGLKIETPEKILTSMLTCEESNYAWQVNSYE